MQCPCCYLNFAGRSNAINIAERLGMPSNILDNARKLHGADSAEINQVNKSIFKTLNLIHLYSLFTHEIALWLGTRLCIQRGKLFLETIN